MFTRSNSGCKSIEQASDRLGPIAFLNYRLIPSLNEINLFYYLIPQRFLLNCMTFIRVFSFTRSKAATMALKICRR